jgi:hypothetical protein
MCLLGSGVARWLGTFWFVEVMSSGSLKTVGSAFKIQRCVSGGCNGTGELTNAYKKW